MQPATEARMWGEFWLRYACKPTYSFKYWAKSTPSMNTIANRLRLADVCITDEIEVIKLELAHRKLMLGIASKLGLGAVAV